MHVTSGILLILGDIFGDTIFIPKDSNMTLWQIMTKATLLVQSFGITSIHCLVYISIWIAQHYPKYRLLNSFDVDRTYQVLAQWSWNLWPLCSHSVFLPDYLRKSFQTHHLPPSSVPSNLIWFPHSTLTCLSFAYAQERISTSGARAFTSPHIYLQNLWNAD